jgi:dTDP-4-dehydrorhamnose reductase
VTRLLITGASGLLGLNLALEASTSHQVMGASRRVLHATPFQPVQADFLERGAVGRLVDRCQPQVVIHCAAAADVDYCERHPEEARRINVDAAQEMAAECATRGVRLVHVSTDAVFDGQKDGAYTETDAPRPEGVYATSKLAGEREVLRACPAAIVVRVNFYGWSISGQRSLAEFFVNNLSKDIEVKGFTDVTFCPMFVGHLAGLLLRLMNSGLHGLYHAVGTDAMSKFDFGNAIARQFGLDPSLIVPQSVDSSGLLARRSHNLRLDTSKLSTELGVVLPDFSTGLREYHRQFSQGYPQRIRNYQQVGVAGRGEAQSSQKNPQPEGR